MRFLRLSGIYLFIASALLFLTGCSGMLATLYGMNKLHHQHRDAILKQAAVYGIPERDCFELDTSYATFLRGLDTVRYKQQIKNHYQPLQALYYKRDGEFLSFYANCYAGGFPNLKWNLEKFVPPTQAPLDTLLPLDVHMLYLNSLSSGGNGRDNPDYWVIVYWNHWMGRQSRRFIHAVRENAASSGKNVKLFYVNNDNFLAREFSSR